MLIEDVSQISKEWLRFVLDSNEEIKKITTVPFSSANATNAIIHLEYEKSLPRSLFLKICKNNGVFVNSSECNYYTKDYKNLVNTPIPLCYNAHYTNKGYHLLLEDLSATHYDNKNVEPTECHTKELAKALACLHAFHWQENKFKLQMDNYFSKVRQGLPAILATTSLAQKDKDFCCRVLQEIPQMMRSRLQDNNGFTMIHGDVNPSNVLSPRQKDGKTYIIDRQPFLWSLTYSLGVHDLAYAIILYWDCEKRRQLEKIALKAYHAQLQKSGISNYSWEKCILDYVLSISLTLCVGISWGLYENSFTKMQWLWEKQLRRSLQALQDWQNYQ
ncbi:hypothetical protein [Candidatus Uabimicrobium sp. HlEnr_7]|uniref:hypothetical protein n=1 Tax=Candidatus Uabimicrobium helgolandensis TaxID=3095367 RepID=UPI0035563AD9